MRAKLIGSTIGVVMLLESVCMLPSVIVALCYKESVFPFLFSIGIMVIIGLPLYFLCRSTEKFETKIACVAASVSWIVISLCGALPFYFCGGFDSFVDCFFEACSGFSTTGSTILSAVEHLSNSVLFWRNFTHMIGGMGIIVLTTAVLPAFGQRTQHLLQAEVPGPTSDKLVPKLANSSKILYAIYLGLTLIEMIILLIAGLPFFDSLNIAIATAGTGGFAITNASIAAYASPVVHIVVAVFMMLFAVNFSIYFLILTGRIREVLKNTELKFFLCVVLASLLIITWNIYGLYGNLGDCLRYAFFSITSLISTTGFGLVDYEVWPQLSKVILFLLMVFGGCAGSTAGGIKCTRAYMLFASIIREIRQMIHPNSVNIIRMDQRAVGEKTLSSVLVFLSTYFATAVLTLLIISLDNFDFLTNFSAVISCLSNIGPGFSLVGPSGNFGLFSDFSKIVLSFCMLIGRLEFFPFLVCFSKMTWKRT